MPLDDPEAEPLLAELPPDERYASWRLARRNGSLVGYAGLRGRIPNALYRRLTEQRDVLGRFVPDGHAPRRFP